MPEENSHDHEAELVRKAAEESGAASDGTATGPSDPLAIGRRHAQGESVEHPRSIGPYKILEPVGEGGMGVVYKARQTKPVRRDVALKLIKLGMDTKSVIARFEAERQALAMMNHPAIAKVFDAGVTEQGRPFFAMEFVQGLPITEHCDRHRLTIDERLELFMEVCHAVQHAHQKGIIHRDIKPSNVLVEYTDGKAVPKIIDFGVAKAMNQRLTENTLFTEQGQMIGTPAYMSPEQADLSTQDIDTRSDIYSLGVLLYELLTGSLPFDSRALRAAGLAEIQRVIREEEPPKPSTRLSSLSTPVSTKAPAPARPPAGEFESDLESTTLPIPKPSVLATKRHATTAADIAKSRRSVVRTLIRKIRGDLDWIVMKCLEKERTRRYETAIGIASDLRRHLHSEPVLASAPGTGYRLRKFVRRNKASVAAGMTVVAVLVIGIVGTGYALAREAEQRRIAEEREREAVTSRIAEQEHRSLAEIRQRQAVAALEQAEAARDSAEAVTAFLTDTLGAVNPEKQGEDVSLREVLDGAASRIWEDFADSPPTRARLSYTVGRTYLALGDLDEAQAHLADAAQSYRQFLGRNHRRTRDAVDMLADLLADRWDFSAAQAHEIASLQFDMNSEKPRGMLAAMTLLARRYKIVQRYAKAEQVLLSALEISNRAQGDKDPQTLDVMNNLAILYRDQGRYAETEQLFLSALEISSRAHGDKDPKTLDVMNNLAILYRDQGRYAEAEPLAAQSVDGARKLWLPPDPELRKVWGRRHEPRLRRYMGTYGTVLLKLERLEEAERFLLDSHAFFKHSRGMINQGVVETDQALFELYERRHAAEPNKGYAAKAAEFALALVERYESAHAAEPWKGYDAKAAEWRAKLAELEVESESGSE